MFITVPDIQLLNASPRQLQLRESLRWPLKTASSPAAIPAFLKIVQLKWSLKTDNTLKARGSRRRGTVGWHPL